MRAGVYLRVSTDRQDEKNQEPSCLKACEARGWTPVMYADVESGVGDRLEWARLMEDARRGEIRAVVFYSISRIGRRRTQIAADLAALTRWGASIVSVTDRFLDVDSSPEMAKMRELLIQWWGWFAETEREQLVERTKVSLSQIRENIRKNGSHVARNGKVITSLGRPQRFEKKWRDRAFALLAEMPGKFGPVAKRIEAEGGPKIGRNTIRAWAAKATP